MLPKLITLNLIMSRYVKMCWRWCPVLGSFVCYLRSYCPLVFQVVTPTGNVLVEDLTLKVESGSNLLITGNIFNSRSVCAYNPVLYQFLLVTATNVLCPSLIPGNDIYTKLLPCWLLLCISSHPRQSLSPCWNLGLLLVCI